MAPFTMSMRGTIATIQDTTINRPLWHDRVSLVFGAYACPSTMLPLAREGLAAGARHMQLQGAGQENVPPVHGGKVRSIGAAPAQRSCMAAVGKCCAGSHIHQQSVSSGCSACFHLALTWRCMPRSSHVTMPLVPRCRQLVQDKGVPKLCLTGLLRSATASSLHHPRAPPAATTRALDPRDPQYPQQQPSPPR